MTEVFARLAGQDDVIAELSDAAWAARGLDRQGSAATSDPRMSHAWLFTGPPGSGRSVAALAFAAALQCADPTITGCGRCQACITTLAGTHADLHRLAPPGVMILLKDVRETIRRASSRPATGRWQVVIVEEADRLTEQSGNALLKVVEEPPPRTVFLLCAPTTDPADIMVTLRSRSRHVYLRTPTAQAVESALLAAGDVDPELAKWAAGVTGGHVGRAGWLARDRATRERRAQVLEIPMVMNNVAAVFPAAGRLVANAETEAAQLNTDRDAAEAQELSTALGSGGTGKGAMSAARGGAGALKELERAQKSRRTRSARDSLDLALVDLVGFYRDCLAVSVGADVPSVHRDKIEQTQRVGAYYSPRQLLRAIEAIQRCRKSIDESVKPKFAVAAMIAEVRTELNAN